MTMDTRDPNTNISELKAKLTIEEWRAKKDELDEANDHVAILGCVGEPLAAWFDSYAPYGALGPDAAKSLIEACIDAKVNLLDMLNEQRNGAYEQAFQEIVWAISDPGSWGLSDLTLEDVS